MCGIAGVVTEGQQVITGELIAGLQRLLGHRGPDDQGFLVLDASTGKLEIGNHGGGVEPTRGTALVHQRLSILDLTATGWQPMVTPDEQYAIVFNGEIYNYIELQRELAQLGHQFRSTSDTEVLLRAYLQWGPAVLQRLVGMFAFAILDRPARKLFLARDFFGIKPLYYTAGAFGFGFASEIKALLGIPGVSRRANPDRLYQYLRYGLTDAGNQTMFRDILQVPPAHYLEVSLDAPHDVRPVRYWSVDLTQHRDISFADASRTVRELFLKNTELHMRSDVPVGAALSGGIDSSSVVMALRHLRGSELDLHTFSFVSEDKKQSEERWIDIVGAASRAQVHKVTPRAEELVRDLDALIYAQDEPFGSTSIYAQYRVFQAARQAGITVMLDGQGADEILGGYQYYLGARLASLLRAGRWSEAAGFLGHSSRLAGRSNVLFRTAGYLLPARFQDSLRQLIGKESMPAWINAGWFRARGVTGNIPLQAKGPEVLRQILYETVVDTSLPHLLRYDDRDAMAWSVESRVPFLTPQLVSFMFSLPEEYLIDQRGTSKAVFRAAMRGIVPDQILDRQDKIGFATPERQWLGTLQPWVESVLQSETAANIPPLNNAQMWQEWQGVVAGTRPFDWRFWRWVNLIRWTELFQVTFE